MDLENPSIPIEPLTLGMDSAGPLRGVSANDPQEKLRRSRGISNPFLCTR